MSGVVIVVILWAWKEDIANWIVKIGIRIKEGTMKDYEEREDG